MALTGTVGIMPDTAYRRFDWDTSSGERPFSRCIGVEFDGLMLHVGHAGTSDAQHIAAIDALISQLMTLRIAAAARMAESVKTETITHSETCSERFATDGTTGERICDCGLAAAVAS